MMKKKNSKIIKESNFDLNEESLISKDDNKNKGEEEIEEMNLSNMENNPKIDISKIENLNEPNKDFSVFSDFSLIQNMSYNNNINQKEDNNNKDVKIGNIIKPDKKKEKKHGAHKKKKNEKIPDKISEESYNEPANPPKKIPRPSDGNDNLKKSENQSLKNPSSERNPLDKKNNINNIMEIIDNDYLLDKMPFNELMKEKKQNKGDTRTIIQMLLSVIKNNSTIYYVFSRSHQDDIFTRISILIFCISFYICLNVFMVFNMDMVLLYTHFKFGCFTLNIFLPCLASIPLIIIKKLISMKELLYNMLKILVLKINSKKELRSIRNLNIKNEIHELENKISEYKNCLINATFIYGIFGLVFLVFNCLIVTSFCGIYPNSVSKLGTNTLVSIIGSCVIIILFYLAGVILRRYSLIKESEILYNISRFFNPLNLSFEEIKKMKFKSAKNENKNNEQNLHDNPE